MPTAGDNPFELNPFIELVMQSNANKAMYQDVPLRNPNVNPGALAPGVYYVGDLSYMGDEILNWDEYIKCIAPNDDWKNVQSGILKTSKGVYFATFSTWCGDGFYYDNDDNEYGVDSGRIGCYPLTKDQIEEVDDDLGNVVEFEHNFTCEYDEETGIMRFDTIFIDTKPEYGA
jgi:hypothetical protein